MAARPTLYQQDFSKIPVVGLVPESSSTPPSSPAVGQLRIALETSPPQLQVYLNSTWVRADTSGSAPLVHSHAISDVTGLQTALDGKAAVVHTHSAADVTSGTLVVARGGTNGTATPTAGAVAYGTGSAYGFTAAGTANQALVSTGGSAPSWVTLDLTYMPTSTFKKAVRVATTGAISLTGTQTIDGVAVVAGDRVLVKDQTTASANGIYLAAASAWARATDADSSAEVTPGLFTFVEEGTTNGDSGFVLSTDGPITLGTTNLAFTQFSGAGQVIGGAGLLKTGNTLDVGAGTGIQVNADTIQISPSYVGQGSITTVGTITSGVWTGTAIAVANGGTGATTATGARTNLGATGKYAAALGSLSAGVESNVVHNLGSADVIAGFRMISNGQDVGLSYRVIDANTIGITADIAVTTGTVRVTVIG